MQTVYIETTIPSYLAARASRQGRIAADQELTHHWWTKERFRFRLFTSAFTLDEAGRGDAAVAARRLGYLRGISELGIPGEFPRLESALIRLFGLPPAAATDASHLALSILHRMDFLLTWNCTHLANAVLQKELMDYCLYHGLHFPIVCTPATLSTEPP